jgi:hypothetical protein
MSAEEMVAYTYLPGGGAGDGLATRILQRSYGVWRARPENPESTAAAVVGELQRVGEDFVAGGQAPSWTTEVAYRSGLALPDVFALYHASSGRVDLPTDVDGWFSVLIDVLSALPNRRAQTLLFSNQGLSGLRFAALSPDVNPDAETTAGAWTSYSDTIRLYLDGASISSIAGYATDVPQPVDQARTVGSKPIPKTLALLQDQAYRLSMLAGGLAALWLVGAEQAEANEAYAGWALTDDQRRALDMLPIAVRCGAGTRSSLAWFRFGVRHRVGAHLLARSFPLPADVEDDADVRRWVRDRRRGWLDGEFGAGSAIESDALEGALRMVAAYERV